MSAIHIRPGTAADMPFFQEMELETTWENLSPDDREHLSRETLEKALATTHDILFSRAGNAWFVAETETGERVGLLWLGENRNLITGENEAWIYNISVVPDYRGQGMGALLLAHAEEHALAAGYRVLGLMVAVHNKAALRLYTRAGFEESNLVMRRRLK